MEFIPFLQDMLGITEEFGIVQIEKIETSEKIIRIYMNYMPKRCKVDGEFFNIYDLGPEREWQHLSWFDYKCYLVCRLPRYIEVDGVIKTYEPKFAPKGRGYTHQFKNEILSTLLKVKVQKTVSELLKTTPYIVRSIMEDAVQKALESRGFVNDLENVSIDEKSYAKGHEYATILMDSDKEYIVDMQEGRKEKSLKSLFSMVTGNEKQPQLKRVNIDMWKPYINVIQEIAPQALIVHDKFHVIKKLTEAIDSTRKMEISECELLKNQKYNLLKNEENRTEKQKEKFKLIDKANLKTAQAWHIRENFKLIWDFSSFNNSISLIKIWIQESRAQKIFHINHVINLIENHLEGIINGFNTKTTSALHENKNSKLQSIIAKARGFINFDRFRINALFYFGNLDLFPLHF
jgi:transposase